jgi:hypothetical protein
MSESITRELLAENVSLREQLSKYKEKDLAYSFQVISLEKPITIRGVLIAEGVWKGIKYSYEEMKKVLDAFKKVPFLIDHGHTQEFGSKVVGSPIKIEADDVLRSLTFEAKIDNPEVAKLIESRQLDSVSIKGEFKNVDSSVSPPVGKDYVPIEISLTSSPACSFCNIFNVELSKSLNESRNKAMVGENMSEELEVNIEEDDILVAPELDKDGEFEFELMKESAYTDELAKKRPGYKVYPGYYPKKVKKGLKKGEKYYPKYPYYKYEKYGKPGKKKLSEEEMLDVLDLASDYRDFMKTCMKGGKDMASCATEWKEKKPAASTIVPPQSTQAMEDEFEEPPELAKDPIKCPVDGKEFKDLEEFKKHWNKEHKDDYGQYKHAKKLARAILTKEELRKAFRKTLSLADEPVPNTPVTTAVEPKQAQVTVPTKTEEELIKEYSNPQKVADLLLREGRKQ